MDCLVCGKLPLSLEGINNDCVLECLERIKAHYLYFRKQIHEKDSALNEIKKNGNYMEATLDRHESKRMMQGKQPQRSSDDFVPNTQCSEVFESCDVDKSVDDLNTALNDEVSFEFSLDNISTMEQNLQKSNKKSGDDTFLRPEPKRSKANHKMEKGIENMSISISSQKKDMTNVKREPMRSLSIISNSKNRDSQKQNENVNASMKNKMHIPKWIAKENELSSTKSFLEPKSKSKLHNLSMKSGRLRQARLQLNVSRNNSKILNTTPRDDETIEASPQPQSSFSRSKSKLYLLGNTKCKVEKSMSDCTFELSPLSPKIINIAAPAEVEKNVLESSSVVMLTPATQDIVFLDESDVSFNIESMDLLKDVVKADESQLSNLKRIESDGIKQLQKTVHDKTDHFAIPLKIEKTKTIFSKGNNSMEDEDLKETYCEQLDIESNVLKQANKSSNDDLGRIQRLLNINCNECKAYIKYLGRHLSDKEIEEHVRKCTKHKKQLEYELTPEGFWDPMIRPLDKNDPRNEILIDDRFVGSKGHN